jgi:hypothetical protein
MLFICSFFLSEKIFAQQADSLPHHHLLIIPFQPEYYLSDAEQDIMKQTRRTPDQYRNYFRKTLDLKITAAVENIVPTISLLYDTGSVGRELLERYYGSIALNYENPIGVKKDRKLFNSNSDKLPEEVKNQHDAGKYNIMKGDIRFMNSTLNDTAFFSKLMKHYDTDLLLSINQFEIKTNYKSCIDISNRIYQRELMVHYSLMNSKGKVVNGNFVVAYFPSSTNRDTEIAERVFPDIAKNLKASLAEILK